MSKRIFVHLINDEKFIAPFFRRAKEIVDNHVFVVFGDPPPYQHLDSVYPVVHSDEWESFAKSEDVEVDRVYVHLMTFQKIRWIVKYSNAPVYWLFYGNDLYELLEAFKGYHLHERLDQPSGILSQVRGKTVRGRIVRWLKLWYYQRFYAPFVRDRVKFFCFWNPGDYELLQKYYGSNAKMLRFQYGAFNPSDIVKVKQRRGEDRKGGSDSVKVLLNHSGSTSGNHHHLLNRLSELWQDKDGMELIAPLSYGDSNHIQSVMEVGRELLPGIFHPLTNFLQRDEYFDLLASIDIAILGHRRQEAGNTLFILFMSGTKVFVHPQSVLIPFLIEEGYVFFTWNDLGLNGWMDGLSEEEKRRNFALADRQFSEERIAENYRRILQ